MSRLHKFVLKTAFSLLHTNCDPTLEWWAGTTWSWCPYI